MKTKTFELRMPDGSMPVYEAKPDWPKSAVVVVQEGFGVNSHIEDVTRRVAAAGYHSVAAHLFYRTGGGTVEYGDVEKIMMHIQALDDDKLLMDLDGTLSYLRQQGWTDSQIGVVGFCIGGRITFLLAARRQLGAAVSFYGGGIVTSTRPNLPTLIGESASVKTPWLGLFGDLDQNIPVEDVEKLREALKYAPVDTEILRYPQAAHGFHCDQRPSYHEASAKDAWPRTLAWFRRYIKT